MCMSWRGTNTSAPSASGPPEYELRSGSTISATWWSSTSRSAAMSFFDGAAWAGRTETTSRAISGSARTSMVGASLIDARSRSTFQPYRDLPPPVNPRASALRCELAGEVEADDRAGPDTVDEGALAGDLGAALQRQHRQRDGG